jgi:hypothetical protein
MATGRASTPAHFNRKRAKSLARKIKTPGGNAPSGAETYIKS